MSDSKPARKSTRKAGSAKASTSRASRSASGTAAARNPSAAPSDPSARNSRTADGRTPKASDSRMRSKPATSKAAKGKEPGAVSPDPHCLIRFPIDVRWRDLDAFNHVNNANFLTYVEEARLAWMQSLAGPWVTETSAPVLAAVQVNFRRPIAWPESLVVELLPGRVGSSSLTLAYRVVAASDASTVYSDGETVMVWVDAQTGQAAPLPDAVRAGTDAGGAAP